MFSYLQVMIQLLASTRGFGIFAFRSNNFSHAKIVNEAKYAQLISFIMSHPLPDCFNFYIFQFPKHHQTFKMILAAFGRTHTHRHTINQTNSNSPFYVSAFEWVDSLKWHVNFRLLFLSYFICAQRAPNARKKNKWCDFHRNQLFFANKLQMKINDFDFEFCFSFFFVWLSICYCFALSSRFGKINSKALIMVQ